MTKTLIKPNIYDCDTEVTEIAPGHKYGKTEKLLQQNKKVCFTKTFGTVLSFYSWLKKNTLKRYPEEDYQSGRIFRLKFRELASNILIKVIDGRAELYGAPDNPWLKEFFPEKECFYIPFPQLLGLNGAWQWFSNGVMFPRLPYRLHPFYGTYFPTRTEHLEMFDEWLYKNSNRFNNAIDIGTGCGVLVFYMLKHKISDISATDINPNAIYSVKKDLEKHGFNKKVRLRQGNFFAGFCRNFNLVVFNPPWIPGKPKSVTDRGIYYETSMWQNFFNEASGRMPVGGKILLLFSNFALLKGISNVHPVSKHLESDNRFSVSNVITRSRKTNKHENNSSLSVNTEKNEIIELWDIEFAGKR